jgi:hypothetical protein
VDGRKGKENGILAMGLLAHKLLDFCGDGDGQSGLGAYVRARTTFNWTIKRYRLQVMSLIAFG